MEDSNKLHEETLKIAKSLIERDPALKDWVTEKFPELKESEDERIRKEIIEYITRYKDCITDKEYNSWIAWLENRVEYNLTPKALFKEGDWITTINDDGGIAIEKIVEFLGNKVRLIDTDGVYMLCPQSYLNHYHLWTIQDARDGDVLCGYPTDDYPWIGIFHESNDDCTFKSYCFLQAGITGEFCPPSGVNIFNMRNVDGHNSKIMVPATKEQRDLLFQKMKEACYEWDTQKKELRKIEQKSAWSEGDELCIELLLPIIDSSSLIPKNRKKCKEFLKSLKERISQPHWKPSEEQLMHYGR